MIDVRKILIGYAGITTLALCWFLVTAAAPAAHRFGEIDVSGSISASPTARCA